MNNELKYHGKTLDEITDSELNQQYILNKQRIIGNGAFLGVVSGLSLLYCPPVVIVPVGIGTFRLYWINKNNKLIEEEANERGMVLKKTKKI